MSDSDSVEMTNNGGDSLDPSVAGKPKDSDEGLPFTIANKPVKDLLPSHFWPENEKPRRVGIAVAVKQISNVDIVQQNFHVYLRCYLDWPATEEECKQYWMRDNDHFSAISRANTAEESFLSFKPWTKFSVVSQESEIARSWTEPKLCWVEKHQRYFIKTNAEFRCTCLEKFELHRFPCDVQNLSICCQLGTGSHGDKWAQLVPIHSRNVICKVARKYSVLDEYSLSETTVFTYFQNSDPKESSVHVSTTSFRVIIKLQRRWKSYFYRIALILSSISLASNAAFIIDAEDVADRIAYLSTMLLAGVAFMFIIYTSLPTIPYLTYMDYYNNAQFIYVLCILIVVCFSNRVSDDSTSLPENWDLDLFLMIISICVWFLYHLVLGIWFTSGNKEERKKLLFNADDYSSEMRGLKTIVRQNVPENWRFGHRYPGASKKEMTKGPRKYIDDLRSIISNKERVGIDWDYNSNLTADNLQAHDEKRSSREISFQENAD